MSAPVIITGMHRSGTSLVASLLQAAGVNVGDRLLAPNEHNPRGFFEDVDFYEFHDRALSERGLTFLVDAEFEFTPTPAEVDRALALVNQRRHRPLWGWKDPRTCLFLDFWHRLEPDATFVFVYRHPLEVLVSLLRRTDVHAVGLMDALRAWYVYNSGVERFCGKHPERAVLCHVHGVVQQTDAFLELLKRRLGLDLRCGEEALRSIVQRDELRQLSITPEIQTALRGIHPASVALYDRLQSMAELRPRPELAAAQHSVEVAALLRSVPEILDTADGPLARGLLMVLLAVVDPAVAERYWRRIPEHIRAISLAKANAERALAEAEAERHNALARLKQKEGQLAERVSQVRSLQASVQQLDTQLAWQRSQAEQATARVATLEEELRSAQEERESLRRDLHALQRTRTVRVSRAIGIIVGRALVAASRAKRAAMGVALRAALPLLKAREPIQGAVDIPAPHSTCSGVLRIEGWAASLAGDVVSVEVFGDDDETAIGVLSYGCERTDVPVVVPWTNDARCGFGGAVDLDHAMPGVRSLRVRVTDRAQNARDFRLTVLVANAEDGDESRRALSAGLEPRFADGEGPCTGLASGVSEREVPQASDQVRSGPRAAGWRGEAAALLRLQEFLANERRLVFPACEHPRVSVIIPTYGKAHYALATLESLLATMGTVAVEVTVVDNGSGGEMRRLLSRLDNARVILNDNNLGFGGACNQAAALATGDYLCFLNSDVLLSAGWLESLVRTMDSYCSCGAVGAKLVHLDGRLQEAGSIIWRDGSACGYGRGGDPEQPEYCYVREVDYCSAACLMVRRDLFQALGGFDERYAPAYYEDTDLCMAVWEAGYKVVYQPEATVYHAEFGSGDTAKAIELQLGNRAKFVDKWQKRLAERPAAGDNHLLVARDRRTGRRILVVDDRIPVAALGQGMPRARALLDALVDLGYVVTFLPVQPTSDQAAAGELGQRGVEVLCGLADAEAKLAERTNMYDVAIVSRPHNAPWMRTVKQYNPRAAVIYDAEAIFALREIRQAGVQGNPIPAEVAKTLVESEVALVDGADAVITVSEPERRIIQSYRPRMPVSVWGHVASVRPSEAQLESRSDLLFVGYLGSAPNEDATTHLLKDILPRIRAQLDCRLYVVGADPSQDIRELASSFSDAVVLAGFVEDLTPFYERCRVFVAPHRFSAGLPLKVVEAMAHGIPCVISGLLADQLELTDGVEVLVGRDDREFAERVVRLYRDNELWERVRQSAISLVESRYDRMKQKERLGRCIDEAVARRPGDAHDRQTRVAFASLKATESLRVAGSSGVVLPPSHFSGLMKTAEYWADRALSSRRLREHWEGHPVVQEAMNKRRGGLSLVDWLATQLPRRVERAVSIGSGAAAAEIQLLRRGSVKTFDIYDISHHLLERAKETAAAAGLSGRLVCHEADINHVALVPNGYDLVTFFASLHHVTNLEYLLPECRRALRPGGVFFAHEYTGPSRFAFPDDHLQVARAVFRTIDPSLRCPWPELPVPDPSEVASADPSEAVRSTELVDMVREYFPEVQVLSLDVALTIILWYGLNHDALYDTREGHKLVRWILDLDGTLIKAKRLWNYQSTFIAIKRDA